MPTLKKLPNFSIAALIFFLPLSAFLVSFTRLYQISLIRDALLLLLIIGSLKLKKDWRLGYLNLPILLFLIWLAASYFWREESFSQWARGVRYLGEPLLLLLVLGNVDVKEINKEKLARYFLFCAIAISVIGLVEFFYPQIVRLSLSEAVSRGRFVDYHAVGGQGYRIQSLLAGPNALGLYLMLAISSFWCWQNRIKKGHLYFIFILLAAALILTASRASWFGLGAALVIGIYLKRDLISQDSRLMVVRTVIVFAILAALGFWALPDNWKFHGASTQLRLEQYQRIWGEKDEIWLTGKGPGSAGLVSQYRFDRGPNYYSENTYLDIFEGLGVIGFALYLVIWLMLLRNLSQQKDRFSGGAFLGAIALFASGLFLTHFTGQAALWMIIIFASLAVKLKEQPNWLYRFKGE